MCTIAEAYKKVPMMFQAQTKGRCQLNYLQQNIPKQDVEIWTEQWTEKADDKTPEFPKDVKTKTYQISWRFVTNGGQDEGIIRPVMGAYGVSFYPGSSMKGAFLQACRKLAPDKVKDYCGDAGQPGCLRFHGGYPVDDSWQKDLVDLVHPQQEWQVKTNNTCNKPRGESAFALISLYQPELKFGISSIKDLDKTEWEKIWQIWDDAVSSGLGCRVSAGYGQPKKQKGQIIYRAYLEGQGIASTVIGGESEFRPNMFKASIRGHALRIFGGLTDAKTAERLVENLFGGVTGSGTHGLLAINWKDTVKPVYGEFESGYNEPTYKVKGILRWRLTQEISSKRKIALTELIKALMRFAMLLGGFGKSWRRVDHRLFYERYYQGNGIKPLIGCHWRWSNKSLDNSNLVTSIRSVGSCLDKVQAIAKQWIQLEGIKLTPNKCANWREAWHQDKVQVWGRIARERTDSKAIKWFHGAYPNSNNPQGSIYRTDVTGDIGQISRIWHRMYPLLVMNPATGNPEYPDAFDRDETKYLELLTIFPNSKENDLYDDFLDFIDSDIGGFQWLW